MARSGDREIDPTITKNLHRLSKYGVLTARPGYEIAGHQLTGRRAIVATVHTKKPPASVPQGEALPQSIGGVPVDVREANAYQRLRAIDPLAAEVSRPEDAEPDWPLERELPSGELLKNTRSETQNKHAAQIKAQPGSAMALTAHQHKPKLDYDPVGCPPLEPIDLTAKVTTAVSLDAGLATLTKFLSGTASSLIIGMYDFTSAKILGDFKSDLAARGTLQIVLDDPAPNPTRNQPDWETVQDLKQTLGSRTRIAWALTRSDHFAAQWSFPYAYHIKVIVRDNNAVWLSSGNLNNSNEPDLSDPPTTEDRDWHVIIEDARARIFVAYLDVDYRTAAANQLPNQPVIEKAIEDARAKRAREANPTPPRQPKNAARAPGTARTPVVSKVFDNLSLKVTPLLTPDKLPSGQQGQYVTHIINPIKGAQNAIYIQLQYIEASKASGSPYDELLQTIKDQIAAKKDVRLIVSANYAEKWDEKMKDEGVDLTANIYTLPNVHNKGFVIDGKQSSSAVKTFRRPAYMRIAMRVSSLRARTSLNISRRYSTRIGAIHARS
jgi:phosphatidylserine/phosphatidylglycerophosphate/cardiolipin synthase-like enzyme